MSKNETFKLSLISIIFTISLLISLPYIPISVDSSLLRIETQLGGYEITIPQKDGDKVIDLKDFKKSKEVGESQKIVLSLQDENMQNREEVLPSLISTIERRLNLAGISDFQTGQEDENSLYVIIPQHESSERVSNLILGTGRVSFKKVKNPDEWSQEEIANFYTEIDRWEDTGITDSDMTGFLYTVTPTGESLLQISFTNEGREKFYNEAEKNIGLPIGMYINDYEYPLLMPVISENILNDRNSDPGISGNFPQQDINDLNLQIKNPLPVRLSLLETLIMSSSMGSNFIYSYLTAFSIGLTIVLAFFVIKFNLLGLTYVLSLALSLPLFAAFSKIMPIPITPSYISVLILVTGIMTVVGYTVLKSIVENTKQEKPFDYALYQTFGKDKGKFSASSILVFFVSLILSFILTGSAKSFMSELFSGMLVVIYFYTLVFPSIILSFGGYKK
ncbi:hypothetical protein K0B04_00755 [Patescibacteria group bacterium]|nr:hypothetical protein [Patescibacteria group bacterium]